MLLIVNPVISVELYLKQKLLWICILNIMREKLKEMASMESISFSNDLDKRARSPEYRRWEERKAKMIKNSFYSNKGRRWYSNASKGDSAETETSEADAYMASLEAEVGA